PERAVQLVERGRAEAGVGGGADGVAPGPLAPGGEAGAYDLAGAGRVGLVKRRGTVRKVELAADAVTVLPAVGAQAAGDQPGAGGPRSLGVEADHRGLAARHAAAGELAGHVAEALAGLALEAAGVGAELPFDPGDAADDHMAQGGVQAPAD